ncbi:MAG: lipopolysaccharide kinase InaA family protein [Candidatus Spyradosoma sp.]
MKPPQNDDSIFSFLPEARDLRGWSARVDPDWDSDDLRELLISSREREGTVLLQQGRERVVRTRCEVGGVLRDVVVKTYRAPGKLREFFERGNKGSKALRAFAAAWILREKQIGTPEPVAVAERRDAKGHLLESRLVTAFVPALTNFRDELYRIYSENPDCGTLMSLMQKVADACRAMHDAGIVHRDLGNQNIALRKVDDEVQVLFIDLDRVRIFPAGTLTDAQRGRDLARLDLPSDLRRVFHSMYYMGYGPPGEFVVAEAKERRAFDRHSALRPWRHPIREWRVRREDRRAALATPPGSAVPLGKELWIWDERSVQAIPAYMSRERRKFRSADNIFRIAKEFFLRGRRIWKNYGKIAEGSFSGHVDFAGTLGMALEATAETSWETQIAYLAELEDSARAKLPVLLRLYHHKGRPQWNFAMEKARELRERGNAVAFALVQDRAAVRDEGSWREMVMLAVEKTHDFADFYEIGHATNRGKWGVWDFADYDKLLAPAIEAKRAFPKIRLTGPACIDFDLHSLPGLLSRVPAGTFSALSQHLYVDRRGAPENFQGKFDLVGKCAIHRAFAETYGFEESKIVVSETNWPLLGAGVYGPIDSPFVMFGPWETRPADPWTTEPPRVSEEDYAKFMCRYLLLAIASGHVSRVYWWRLVHRGFGLVDDSAASNPRPRPAFFALKNLLSQIAGARFERRVSDVPAGTFALEFSRADGSRFTLRWTRDSFPEIA